MGIYPQDKKHPSQSYEGTTMLPADQEARSAVCAHRTQATALPGTLGPPLQDHALDFHLQVAKETLTAKYLLSSSTVSKTVACKPDLAHRYVFFGLNDVGSIFFWNQR